MDEQPSFYLATIKGIEVSTISSYHNIVD